MGELPRILITTGDPNGIGPEISIKAMQSPEVAACCKPMLVGSPRILERAARALGDERPVEERIDPGSPAFWSFETGAGGTHDLLPVMEAGGESLIEPSPGTIQAEAGLMAFRIVEKAHTLLEGKVADAMVTCPINKEALHKAGRPQVAHTEILAHLTGTPDPLTLFVVKKLWIAFFTRHLSLADAVRAVRREPLVRFVERLHQELIDLGKQAPSLAMAALNPHGGEGGLLGKEEIEEINPAVQALQEEGIDIAGPIPADSVFHLAKEGRFDCVVSLFHDQGHIAAKTAHFHDTVSLTLGLPYLRSSVDHGTGFDIAWQGKAKPDSLIEAVRLAAELVSTSKSGNSYK
ncbi:MAG: 4-hydroxythreonine-4-phosphate dehydrogenase PdxA [Planctomycetota bacterium]|jgi:4-hydroxythreonine-4-phosphate dehydrogenase